MSQSPATSQAPILKGSWSDAEKLALLVSIIKSVGAPKWSNGIAVPEGRTLQASAKMYSELLKASASVKMTTGDSVTPSGKRPRLGGFGSRETGSPMQKRQKKAAATPKEGKKAGAKKSLSSLPVGDGDEDQEEGDDDESPGEGDEDEKKVVVKKEMQGEDEKGMDEVAEENQDAV